MAIATTPTDSTAQQELADTLERISLLAEQVIEIDGRLTDCSLHEGSRLIKNRTDAVNEMAWLEGRLPALEASAKQEMWQERRSELNQKWLPLVQQQREATEALEASTCRLIERIASVLEILAEQRKLLFEHRGIDELLSTSERRDPRSIAACMNALTQRPPAQIAWVYQALQPHLANLGPRAQVELMPASNPAFQPEIL